MSDNTETRNIVNNNRIGIFMLDISLIRENPDVVQNIMSKVIPIKILPHLPFGMFEYMAISKEFDELNTNEIIPIYSVDINYDNSISFIRKNYRKKTPDSVITRIMQMMAKHEVSMSDFKEYVKKYQPDVDDSAFETYDETFLDVLTLYVNRNKK